MTLAPPLMAFKKIKTLGKGGIDRGPGEAGGAKNVFHVHCCCSLKQKKGGKRGGEKKGPREYRLGQSDRD